MKSNLLDGGKIARFLNLTKLSNKNKGCRESIDFSAAFVFIT